MKRILFLSLILLFLFLLTTVVFSADDIDDPLAPLSPDIVTNDRYKPFDEELIPESPPVIDIEDDEIPEALPGAESRRQRRRQGGVFWLLPRPLQ